MAARSSSVFCHELKHDVFLSFRSEDTRMGFASHLYSALNRSGIRTFVVDDESIRRGEDLTPELAKVIEESRIAIVVFSRHYAYSTFCLNELAKIVEYFKGKGRLVLPVFYGVDPSNVQHQRGSYGEALDMHEEKFKDDKLKVNKWRMALHQAAADFSGFHFNHSVGYEHEFIGRIVKEVCSKISPAPLHTADYPVGLEPRVQQLRSLLDVGSNDQVPLVGIYGIGGVGKTTLARAVYNSISDCFEGLCFLGNVSQISTKYGLVHIQQMLLSKIVGEKDINIGNVSEGISMIKDRVHHKKVLIVLDDVDKITQLQTLVGGHDWFGSGSRVIIISRDQHLLAAHGVKVTYKLEGLSQEEALDLLCWNAFKSNKVDPGYADLLNRAVPYASGLPLALELIGSHLFGKSIGEWNYALAQYERIPNRNIQMILEVSFDSLEEEEMNIFLDIACFFNGHKLSDIEDILSAHYGFSVKKIIEVLMEKSLLKVGDGLVCILHDLVQDMGREIVRQESPEEPGRRSRLWFFQDIVQVLENNTGSSEIESLVLDFPKDDLHSNGPEGAVNWDGEAFKKMKNLKMLIITNCRFSKGTTHLPRSLRVLKWGGYPSSSLPPDFNPKKLAILELPHSCLKISDPIQRFVDLTALDFSYCEQITRIPDLSGLSNLEQLSLKNCKNLIAIHESVGFLNELRILDAVHCMNLQSFPPIRLPALELLDLSHCSALESFPEVLGKMENITELHLMGSPIKELPVSIRNLTRLRKLELQSCGIVQLPSSIVMMPELSTMHVSRCQGLLLSKLDQANEMVSSNTERLILSYCNISDKFLSIDLTWFANVRELNLSGNNFIMIPECFKECHLLRNLKLDDCRLLQEIRGIPWKLETLSAKGCTSLEHLDVTVLPAFHREGQSLRKLVLDDCVSLREIGGPLPNLDNFSAKNCAFLTSWCTSMLLNQEPLEAGNRMFALPGSKIPEWFTHCTREQSISFWFRNEFPAIFLCLLIGLGNEDPVMVKFSPLVVIDGNRQILANQKVYEFRIATDHIFLFDLHLLNSEGSVDTVCSEKEWSRVDVSFADHITKDEVPINLVTKQIGIHVFKQTNSMENIIFTDLYFKKRKLDDFLLMREPIDVPPCQRVKIPATRAWKSLTSVPSLHSLASTQPAGTEKGQASSSTPFFERIWDDEVHPISILNDVPVNEESIWLNVASIGKLKFAESSSKSEGSDQSSSSSEGLDSDDPFDQVNTKLGKQTMSYGICSGNASLKSIQGVMDSFELIMVKDLSDVSSDPAMQFQLDHLLDLLSTSSHPKVTVDVKESLMEFKRKAFESFQEFQATVEAVSKLKTFEKHKDRIQQESLAGKDRWKDMKNSMKKASLAIKVELCRKEELEAEIETLKKQLAARERDLQQVVFNVKNLEAAYSTHSRNCASLNERAQALLKEAVDLVAANTGVEDDGEVAEINQSRLKSTWSIDLTSLYVKIRNKILGRM